MALYIYRRDLRLEDNPALAAAVASGLPVYPIFIANPIQVSKNKNSCYNKRVVDLMLSSIPKGTMVFKGDPVAVIKKILKTGEVGEIYLNKDYTPYSIARDEAIAAAVLASAPSVKLHTFDEATLLPPGTLRTGAGGFFKKFTPFKEKFLANFRNQNPKPSLPDFDPKKLPETLGYIVAMETETRNVALELLRNIPVPDPKELLTSSTSGISPYLKLGVVSVREVYSVFKKKKFTSLIEGLVWREFYYNIAVGFPGVLAGSLVVSTVGSTTKGTTGSTTGGTPGTAGNLSFRKEIKWWYTKPTDNPFVLWTQGKTGFPVVDACMRQLKATGELCGRGRMIVGSFLTKILLVDWRLGEQWFAQNLIDYDPALNNGNWQWVAGCGVDVQPYIRILNPTTQGLKHDPEGDFARKWLPELRKLTVKEIYSEGRASLTIVDYKKRRAIAMKLFRE